jgi:hypothetical protein
MAKIKVVTIFDLLPGEPVQVLQSKVHISNKCFIHSPAGDKLKTIVF